MYRYLALSLLLLCAVVQYTNGGTMGKYWGEKHEWDETDWDEMGGDDWKDKADEMKDFLKECVKGGKLSKDEAMKMHESLKWGMDNSMKWDVEEDKGDDHAWGDDRKHDDKADDWAIDENKDKKHHFKKALKRLGYLFKDARSSGKEWAKKVKDVMHFLKNQAGTSSK